MLQKVVAVVPLSQSKACNACGASFETESLSCPQCRALPPIPLSGVVPSYFEVMGLPVSLAIDTSRLQTRYHALSKQVHPDKFATQSPQQQSLAMRWSTLLNRAYQTLKARDKRANYLLEREGISRTKNAKVPVDLAESYFELQDLLQEGGSDDALIQFRDQLLKLKEEYETNWAVLEKEWDSALSKKEVLQKISDLLNEEHYLESMLEDVVKKLGVASANRRN